MQSRRTDFREPRRAAKAGAFLNEEYLPHNRPRSASSAAGASHPAATTSFSRLRARCEARIARPGAVR